MDNVGFCFQCWLLFHTGFLGILSWRGTTLLICNRMISKFKCNKEYFSNECQKTKTKVITLASHKGHKQPSETIKI